MLSRLHDSFVWRLVRTLLPSPMSALLCLFLGIGVVGLYLVLMSVSLGTSLPSLFDGEWGIAYTNHVVQPLLTLFNNFTVNKLIYLGLWAFAGLTTYFLLEYTIQLFRNMRSAERDIQLTAYGIIRHPAISSFFVAAIWRAGILMICVPTLIVVVWPPVQQLSDLAPHAILGSLLTGKTILHLVLLAVQFTLFFHGVVVLIRLFAMRMRLFGDDPI